jgi:V/A-type H+-transporting ATPase subunit C
MVSKVRRYAFINAKLRARISQLLPDNRLKQIAEAPSLDQALSLLRGTSFTTLEEIYRSTGDLKACELELFSLEVRIHLELKRYVEGEVLDLARTLALRYEIENLKNGVRLFFEKVEGNPIQSIIPYLYRGGIVNQVDAAALAEARDLDEVARLLEQTPYRELFERHRRSLEKEKSLFALEVDLDHYYYRELLDVARKLNKRDRPIALRLIGVEIDLTNVSWIIRYRTFHRLPAEGVPPLLIPHGITGTGELVEKVYGQDPVQALQALIRREHPGLAALLSSRPQDAGSRLLLIEQILRQILMHEAARMLAGDPFTVGILLSYVVLKREEIRKLLAVLNAKQYGMAPDRIRSL